MGEGDSLLPPDEPKSPATRRFQPTGGKRRRDAEELAEKLSPRQREVLTLLLRGSSVKEIARDLDIKPNTVNEHVKALHEHFAVSSRAELLALFVPTFY